MNSLVRILGLTTLLAGIVLLGYWRLTVDQQARAIRELEAVQEQLRLVLAKRQAMIERLSRSHRLAHVQITDQELEGSGRVESTTFNFVELDDQGAELDRQTITIPGDVLFIDAWTVKFDAEMVAEGDVLRGRTLVLLRRAYSDRMNPQDGIALDVPGAIPPGYAASDAANFEKHLWERFWLLTRDAQAAAELGVRIAQGEAVYKPVRKGETYELLVDALGGMSLKPLDAAALSRAASE
jgi:hypothetical protein